jgi:hypothetical protein
MDFRPMIFPERMKAIALADPLRAALAMSDAASELFSKSAQRLIISSVIGGSSNQVGCRNATLPTNHRWPTASRSLATALWAARSLMACSAELHHALGRDPRASFDDAVQDLSSSGQPDEAETYRAVPFNCDRHHGTIGLGSHYLQHGWG